MMRAVGCVFWAVILLVFLVVLGVVSSLIDPRIRAIIEAFV